MSNALKICIGLLVAVVMTLSALVGIGSTPRRSVANPNFACATLLNTYGICIGPPTTDK